MLNKAWRLHPKAITDIESIYLYGAEAFGLKKIESHVIFFKTTKTGIAIIRVLHKSSDYLRHL